MSDPVTYYGPEMAPTPMVTRFREPGEKGLVSLSLPDSEEVIVTGVRVVESPESGCAVAAPEDPPAKPAKKGNRE